MNNFSSACAKTILFGEHAVVYGEPAVAIPLHQIRTTARLSHNSFEFRIISSKTGLNKTYYELNSAGGLYQLLKILCDVFSFPDLPADTLEITSEIPIASGLGSGAALSIAIIREFCRFYNKFLSEEDINRIAFEIEKIYHGNPSGIDNTTITYEQPVIFSKTSGFSKLSADISSLNLLVVNSGIRSKTIDVVTDVKKNIDKNMPFIKRIGSVSNLAVQALISGDIPKIGELMNENQVLLKNIDVSCKELDEMLEFGRNQGAIGAKLTGAGRGGNFLLLARDHLHALKLKELFESQGLRVIL